MPTSKVVYGRTVLVDLTSDTVNANSLLEGITAHDKAGNLVTGTLKSTENIIIFGTEDPTAEVMNALDGNIYIKFSEVL